MSIYNNTARVKRIYSKTRHKTLRKTICYEKSNNMLKILLKVPALSFCNRYATALAVIKSLSTHAVVSYNVLALAPRVKLCYNYSKRVLPQFFYKKNQFANRVMYKTILENIIKLFDSYTHLI